MKKSGKLENGVSHESFRIYFNDEYQKYLKKNHRFSLRSFAKSLGLAPSTTHQYLAGRYPPSPRNLEHIARRLNWSAEMVNKLQDDLGRREIIPHIKLFESDPHPLPATEVTVKILSLCKKKDVPTKTEDLLKYLALPATQAEEVKKTLQLLHTQDLLESDGPFIKFKYNVKLVATNTPEGNFLDFQKQALRRMEHALTGIPKKERLNLIATLQIAESEMEALSDEINDFAARIRRRFGKVEGAKFYQVVVGATPF